MLLDLIRLCLHLFAFAFYGVILYMYAIPLLRFLWVFGFLVWEGLLELHEVTQRAIKAIKE